MEGWIKIYRQLQMHWLWENDKPFDKRSAWIDLLLTVNHKSNKFPLGDEVVSVAEGETITSEHKLADRWGWSRTKVRKFLKLLENDEMISVKKVNRKRTSIKIRHYRAYQGSKNHRKTTEKPQKNLNKNDKNDKKNICADIINYLNKKANKNFSPKTEATQKLINGRLVDGYSVEDFYKVIDVKVKDWKGKKTSDGQSLEKFLRPNTLFRPGNFENYVNEWKPGKQEFTDELSKYGVGD